MTGPNESPPDDPDPMAWHPTKGPAPEGRRWCAAGSKQRDAPCDRLAKRGGKVCHWHGGAAPQTVAKAAERVAIQAASTAVATYGLRRDVDPLSALLEEVQWTAGHVEWLRGKVQEHADGDLVWGMTEQKSGEDTTTTHKAAPNVWLALYQAERKHLTAVCGEAIRSGVAERTVQLEERRGELLAGGLRWLLGALVLSPVQVVQVPELVPRMLRALASGDLASLPAGGGG